MDTKRRERWSYKRIVAMSILFWLMSLMVSCGEKKETEEVNHIESVVEAEKTFSADELIQRLMNDQGKGRPQAVHEDLERLSGQESELYEKWNSILNFQTEVNRKGYVCDETLPEDLYKDKQLCIVVLGYQLNDDGSMKDELIGRLSVAKENALQYPNAYVLVTGGGTARANEAATEADCMADWLISEGIDADRILIENKSRTTVENVLFSYEILEKQIPEVRQLALVTSDYHIPLGSVLFEAQFILNDAPYHIVANASYDAGKMPFSIESQCNWLYELWSRQ